MERENDQNSPIFPLILTILTLGLGLVVFLAVKKKKEGGATLPNVELDEREARIVNYLEDHGNATVPQLKMIAPSVTQRTLRRDLAALEEKGFVVKTGSTKSSMYHLARRK